MKVLEHATCFSFSFSFSAKEAAGSKIRGGALPGITRKVVALSLAQEPGQLLKNFRNQEQMVALGVRFSSPVFVAFTILMHHMFKGIVAPFALVSHAGYRFLVLSFAGWVQPLSGIFFKMGSRPSDIVCIYLFWMALFPNNVTQKAHP